jgi:hypothetical protein
MNRAGLFDALGAVPRLPGAACREQHELFDLLDLDDPDRAEIEARALQICQTCCPALTACERWFDGLPARLQPTGVIGGQVRRPAAPGRRGRPRTTVAS